jgi:hypothetical protein
MGQDTAVLDNTTGVVHMLFTKNNTEVYVTSSSDDGASWSAPLAIKDKPGCPSCWIAPSFSAVQLIEYNKEHVGDLVACLGYSYSIYQSTWVSRGWTGGAIGHAN